MARARALVLLLAAFRSASLHAAEHGAPAAASMPFFTQVAASGAPAAAYRGFSTQAAVSTAPAAASRCFSSQAASSSTLSAASRCLSAPAPASSAPSAAASEALLGSALEPVGVGGFGGVGRIFLRLGYGALATFAGLVIMTSCAPVTEWDLVHEELQAEYAEADEEKRRRRRVMAYYPRGRPPSAREVRQNTEMLKIVHRRLKELLKEKQKDQSIDIEKKQPDRFWDGLDDLIKKWKPFLSAVDVVKDTYALIVATVAGSVYLHQKFGDPYHFFVCPYSGHTEVVSIFLFSVTPNDETKQGDGSSRASSTSSRASNASQKIISSKRTNSASLEGMGIKNIMGAFCCQKICEFTIVRPLNWIGPRMDFVRRVDGPSEAFEHIVLRREPLKLVDGGESQRTFVYIKDAIEPSLSMIENPARANGHIFNVGNPNNEVTVMELAVMTTEVYPNVSGEPALEEPVISHCEGYEDKDKKTADMALINKQLAWNPMTSLKDLLETTLTYLHKTYKEAVKTQMSQALASS